MKITSLSDTNLTSVKVKLLMIKFKIPDGLTCHSLTLTFLSLNVVNGWKIIRQRI